MHSSRERICSSMGCSGLPGAGPLSEGGARHDFVEEFAQAVDPGPDLLYRRLAEGEAGGVAAAAVTKKPRPWTKATLRSRARISSSSAGG